MIHIALLALFVGTAHAHVCSPLSDQTTIAEIRECMDWQPDAIPDNASCVASTAGELRSCLDIGGFVSLSKDIEYAGCPTLINVQSQSDIVLNGNGHTILRTGGHRQCSLVDIKSSQRIMINDLTLDDDARVAPCVVADNCPRMIHVRDSSNVTFDGVHVLNGKGYVIYTDNVQGFGFSNGSLKNSGVLGMYIGHGDNISTYVNIIGNTFTDNSTNALAVLGADNVQINGNTFQRNHNRGQWPVAPRYGTGLTGGGQVYIARASNVTITDNIISDGSCSNCRGGIHGIELSEPNKVDSVRDVIISGNTIERNTGQSIYTNQGSRVDGLIVNLAPVTPTTPATGSANSLKIEAESVALTDGWINRGEWIEWIGNTELYLLSQRRDASNLTFTFSIPKAGKYRLNFRAKVGTIFNQAEPGNDYWLKLPGKDWIKVYFNRDGSWTEDAIGEQGASHSRELLDMTLPAGPVTITLSGRSRGAILDYVTLEPQGVEVGSAVDLIIINTDMWPDRDDIQYITASKSVVDTLGLDPIVVVGTYGEDPSDRPHMTFIPGAVEFTLSIYPAALDAHNDKQGSASTVADAIIATLSAGYKVSISEGGTSDQTARVLRIVEQRNPSLNLKQVSVYQHSTGATAFNENKALPANLAYVKAKATYVNVPNGNIGGNGSADFQEPESSSMCQRFMTRARSSVYGNQWQQAFTTLGNEPARRCDMSDLVSLLAIVGDTQSVTFDNFSEIYLK